MSDFSILHATIRLPDGWVKVACDWMDKCDRPEEVEYILAIDQQDARFLDELPITDFAVQVVINKARHCSVDAFNLAARESTGKFLIQTADDWFPPPHWDTEIRKRVDFDKELVLDVDSGHFTGHIIICPMMTRKYYERPGRGACGGEFFYPEYMSMGADDDLTEYARRDGVVVTAYDLPFEHRHPWRGITDHDTHGAYAHNQSLDAWHAKDAILPRRRADNFSK